MSAFHTNNSPFFWAAFTAACVLWATALTATVAALLSALSGSQELMGTKTMGAIGIIVGALVSGSTFFLSRTPISLDEIKEEEDAAAYAIFDSNEVENSSSTASKRTSLKKIADFIRNPDTFWS